MTANKTDFFALPDGQKIALFPRVTLPAGMEAHRESIEAALSLLNGRRRAYLVPAGLRINDGSLFHWMRENIGLRSQKVRDAFTALERAVLTAWNPDAPQTEAAKTYVRAGEMMPDGGGRYRRQQSPSRIARSARRAQVAKKIV